jgi:chromosome segregation ATPase
MENLRRNFDKERGEMMKQIETSKSYSTQLKSDYDNLYKSYEDFQAQLSSHSDKSSKLISENMQLTTQLKEAQAEIFNLKSQYEALDSNYKRVNDQIGSATGREEIIKSLRNTITILESRLETFQSELNRNRDYERLLNEKSVQCTSLESQLQLKSKEASDLFKTNKDQSISLLKQKEEIESLRSNLSKSQLACDSLKSSSADSLTTIKKLQAEIQDLRRSNTEELEKFIFEKTKSVSQGIDKISTAIQSIENNLHCMHCFETLNNAVICVPCGHWYCEQCTQGYNSECSQCSMVVEISVRSVLVDEMVSKISYSKETLGHIHRIFKT